LAIDELRVWENRAGT